MTFKILPTKEFSKDFEKLDFQVQRRIKDKVEEVAENPARYKHLHYDLKNSCRLRIGKLRLIFSYNQEKREIYLEKLIFDHKYSE